MSKSRFQLIAISASEVSGGTSVLQHQNLGNFEHSSLIDLKTDIAQRGKKSSLIGGANTTGPRCACKASHAGAYKSFYKPKDAVTKKFDAGWYVTVSCA